MHLNDRMMLAAIFFLQMLTFALVLFFMVLK
jgi:hypothetical protein